MELIDRARGGDEAAFAQLTAPLRRELQVHCYRMLGSAQDAEDALQETLLAAWQALGSFEGRASIRTWLYRIATNRCLNMLRAHSRRPAVADMPGVVPPTPTRMGEVSWLEPYPDFLLDGAEPAELGPEACYEARESVSLAFLFALQRLPARQRAVVVLRDVLGYPAADVADVLGTTVESVKGALKRARSTLGEANASTGCESAPAPGSPEERAIVERFATAYRSADLAAVLSLLADDVTLTMPPLPFEYHGKLDTASFLVAVVFQPDRTIHLLPTRANRQPAFAFYVNDPGTGIARPIGLLVLTLAGSKIAAITRFEPSVLPTFGLPRTVPL